MSNSTPARIRKKPQKPRQDFPLFAHSNGSWAKKINGRLVYFGPWADPFGAEQKYLDQKDDLHAGRPVRDKRADGLNIVDLVNAFLTHKENLVATGELAKCTFNGYHQACSLIVEHFGRTRTVATLEPADFDQFRAFLANGRGLVSLGNLVNRSKIVFNYAPEIDEHFRRSPVWFGRAFRRPRPEKIEAEREVLKRQNGQRDFDANEIRQMLKKASQPLKAMILLGVNCGFGNTDCSRLPRSVLEDAIETEWINYPRPKTTRKRRCKLWPQTIDACKEALFQRVERTTGYAKGCAFATKYGGLWVKPEGNDDAIAKEFAKLCKEAGIKRRGVGFYGLRRTFATVGSECRDQVAVDCIMGHRDYSSMSDRYRQRVSDERLQAVTDTVHRWLYAKKVNRSG